VATPGFAFRQQALSLSQRARRAERIVVGRITAVRVGHHPRYAHLPVTQVTLQVTETWKGAAQPTLTFMQFGDASATGPRLDTSRGPVRFFRFPDLPTYRQGEEILLFLRRPSEAGLTSPVGGRAGKVLLHRDAATGTLVVGEAALLTPERLRSGESSEASLSLTSARARVRATLKEAGR
jgi:hypothetical protein